MRLKHSANSGSQPQTHQTRCRQHDGVIEPLIKLAQAGVQVATQGLDAQVGPQSTQQRHAAQAGGADDSTLGQFGQVRVVIGNQGITRVFALHHAGQDKTFGQRHRHVLERVHGQVGTALLNGHLQLFDEQAFAADFAQAAVQNLVALGRHAQERDLMTQLGQQRFDMFSLPQGQTAFAGGDGEFHSVGR